MDAEDAAPKMVDRHTLTYPVLYGLNAREVAATIGGYLNEEPLFLQPSGFILRPDGTIVLLVQSSGPLGRLFATDTLGLIEHYQKQG